MKYKSELIKDIVETRGHEKSSLHYESECIEPWIEEVKGAYPKLCDYEGEWLNYMVENPIGSFPYETITANPTATVSNVVPYRYKNAILKGQTLVNQINTITETNQRYVDFSLKYIDITKKQLFIFNSSENVDEIGILNAIKEDWNSVNPSVGGVKSGKVIITPNPLAPHGDIRIRCNNSTVIPTVTVMVIEYREGMENWDIPYFEGMQSVKVPVLKTTGKNTFNIKNKGAERTGWYSIPLESPFNGEIYVKGDNSLPSDFRVNILANKNEHTISNDKVKGGYTSYYQNLTNIEFHCRSLSIQANSRGSLDDLIVNGNIVIELGGEPYKSNILTVNEEVELRGIGSGSNRVEDELDCLTGEVTERIGEVVYTEKEDWYHYLDNEFDDSILFSCTSLKIGDVNDSSMKINFISDTFTPSHQIYTQNIIGSYIQRGSLFIRVKKEWLTTPDVYGLKQYLQVNPITIQFPLDTESIKTVDLTIVNQDDETLNKIKPLEGTMNIKVSGNPVNPIGVFEVPVEAITQNLSSFIEEE